MANILGKKIYNLIHHCLSQCELTETEVTSKRNVSNFRFCTEKHWMISTAILYSPFLHIPQSTFVAPKTLHNHCFQFLPGNTGVPREILKTMVMQHLGGRLTSCIMVCVKMVNFLSLACATEWLHGLRQGIILHQSMSCIQYLGLLSYGLEFCNHFDHFF